MLRGSYDMTLATPCLTLLCQGMVVYQVLGLHNSFGLGHKLFHK